MKTDNGNKIKVSSIIMRIILFAPMLFLALICSISMFIKFMVNFVLHGGECFAYTFSDSKDTIREVYELVAEDIEYRKNQQIAIK